jgi:hypothetical protein
MMRAMVLGLIVVLAVPAAVVLTFMLSPFWNWFEARFGIESIGHSGPANWCFGVVFIVTLCFGFGTWSWFGRKKD